MNKCPECGHEWPEDHQIKAGQARWSGVSKAERSEAAKKAAAARWAKSKGKTKPKEKKV